MKPKFQDRSTLWLESGIVLVATMFAFLQVGWSGTLFHDAGLYLYGGQQMLEGVPPYVSIFDMKAPLGTMLSAAGVGLGRLAGLDDLLGARLLFFALACALVLAVYHLARRLFRSPGVAAAGTGVFIACSGVGAMATTGPMPKTAAVLFLVLTLLSVVEKRWFLAGVTVGLAGLTWQPTGSYLAVVLLLAWFQQDEPKASRRAATRALVGALLPLAATVAYFASHDALFDLVDGSVIYPLVYHENARAVGFNLRRLLTTVLYGYGASGQVIAVGLFMLGPLFAWRRRASSQGLLRDRFAVVLLTAPLPLIWSLRDFQNYPDLLVFLPYAALGVGWLIERGLWAIGAELRLRRRAAELLPVALAVFLVLLSARVYWFLGERQALPAQQESLELLLEEFGEEARIVAIGAPHALALLGRTNATRYGSILVPAAVRHIDAREPGGFDGWVERLAASKPDLLLLGTGNDLSDLSGSERRAWRRWMRRFERHSETDDWVVLVARERRATGS